MLLTIVKTLRSELSFSAFVSEKMEARQRYVINKQNFKVEILPEFVWMFKNSKHVSCKFIFLIFLIKDERGRSHYLIRQPANKRRKIEESKDVVIVNDDIKQENLQLKFRIIKIKEDLKDQDELNIEINYLNWKFNKHYQAGVVDKDLNLK